MPTPLLTVSGLNVTLNRNIILEHVDFTLNEKEILAVIGPNGSGKTTLFKVLLGLVPYTGRLQWQRQVKIGYVPQRLSVDPDMPLTTMDFFNLKKTNRREIDFALSVSGFEKDKPHKGHLEEHILNQKMGLLSGGELQRVLIAWALIGNPDVLLFDEPTSGVDIGAEETIYELLHRLQTTKNLTIMLISHDLQIVSRYATHVLCLNKKEVCYGTPSHTLNQENLNRLFGGNVGLYQHH